MADMTKTASLPEPFTPADCDLRGNDWMPLHGTKLFGSRFYSLARRDPRAGLAGIKLWWEAWMQCPAASLPSDDFDLCSLAGFGEDLKAWAKVKAIALHGFVQCSDGRLYHKMLAEEALTAYAHRLKSDRKRESDAERLRAWRMTRAAERVGNTGGNAPDTPSETPDATRVKRVSSEGDRTGQDRTGQSKQAATGPDPTPARPPAMPARSDPPDRWASLAEKWEVDDTGIKRPVVAGYYLDVVAGDVCDAARINDANWRGDWRPLIAWLRDGIDAQTIANRIRAVAARSGYRTASTLKYFDGAVREAAPR